MVTRSLLFRLGLARTGTNAPMAPPPADVSKVEFARFNSITYEVAGKSVTQQFEGPAPLCGLAADGKTWLIHADTPTTYTWNKPSRQVASTTYPGLPTNTLVDIDGEQRDPFLPAYRMPSIHAATADGKQGACGFLQHMSGAGSNSAMGYARERANGAPLNWDPAWGVSQNGTVRGIILPTDNFAIVKSLTKAGMTSPPVSTDEDSSSRRFFDLHAPFYIVDTTDIPRDPIPFGVSATERDWTQALTKAQLNKEVFGDGFDLEAIDPQFLTLEEMRALGYFHTNFKPECFGLDGELLRAWIIEPGVSNNESSGYSRDYAQTRADWVIGLAAAGADNVTDADMVDIAMYAMQLDAVQKRLGPGPYEQPIGAGQHAGTAPAYTFGAFMLKDADPTMCDRVLQHQSNVTHQPFQVQPKHVGMHVYWGTPVQGGGANHGVQKRTYTWADVGRYMWSHTFRWYNWAPDPRMDAEYNADYETNSAGIANVAEWEAIGCARNGPGGRTGWQFWTQAPAGGTQPFSAMLYDQGRYAAGYYRRYHLLLDGTVAILDTGKGSIATQRIRSLHKARYAVNGIGKPETVIDAPTIEPGRLSQFVWTSANGVGYDLRDERLGGYEPDNPPLRRDLRWRPFGVAGEWTQIDDAPDQNADLVIPAKGRPILFALRRWVLVNGVPTPGPWSGTFLRNWSTTTNLPIDSTQLGKVTPGGSGGAVTWNSPPVAMRKEYPLWVGSDYVPVESPVDATLGIDLVQSIGKPVGDLSATPTHQWRRGATPSAATSEYTLTGPDDLNVTLNGTVAFGAASAEMTPLVVPNRPALAAGVIVDTSFGPEFPFWNWEIWETMKLWSRHSGNPVIQLDPGAGPFTVNEVVTTPNGSARVTVWDSTNVRITVTEVADTPMPVWTAGQTVTGASGSGVISTTVDLRLFPQTAMRALLGDGTYEDGLVHAQKLGSSPKLRADFTARQAADTSGTYNVTVGVGLGLTSNGSLYETPTFRLGTTLATTNSGGAELGGIKAVAPVPAAVNQIVVPQVQTLNYTINAPANGKIKGQLQIPTGTGLKVGGNPELASLKIVKP